MAGRAPALQWLIQFSYNFGIAHIDPFADEIESFYFLTRMREVADCLAHRNLEELWLRCAYQQHNSSALSSRRWRLSLARVGKKFPRYYLFVRPG
jgi:hypothetical protein